MIHTYFKLYILRNAITGARNSFHLQEEQTSLCVKTKLANEHFKRFITFLTAFYF